MITILLWINLWITLWITFEDLWISSYQQVINNVSTTYQHSFQQSFQQHNALWKTSFVAAHYFPPRGFFPTVLHSPIHIALMRKMLRGTKRIQKGNTMHLKLWVLISGLWLGATAFAGTQAKIEFDGEDAQELFDHLDVGRAELVEKDGVIEFRNHFVSTKGSLKIDCSSFTAPKATAKTYHCKIQKTAP